ncbi:CynX/NimT family MFS transporter [Siminovitchia sediminis]|uniref:CynX/NimT family MFS transporter n=1 Tax=Siminovitchia sediminis TaxID=1274353 RepID=A0ABW4KJJ5_9BACI
MVKNTTLDYQSKQVGTWGLFIGIILIGANLRAPLTSVGSLLPFIRDDVGISNTLAGLITTLPLLAFAFLSPLAPKIASRIGMEWTVFWSLFLLTMGMVVRSYFGTAALFAGTVFIGLAIAIGNVLIPGMIKKNFPYRIGLVTGMYAVIMNFFAALASGISVPVSFVFGIGWKGALAFWTILSILAMVIWIPQIRRRSQNTRAKQVAFKKSNSLLKSPLAWHITLYMGAQSLMFYTASTWVPVILQSYGYSSSSAGWMLSLMQFTVVPFTFLIPVMAEKMGSQRALSVSTGVLFFLGSGGLFLGHHFLIPISVIFIGIASGSAFSLSMMFFSLRASSGQQAAEISGMAQSVGYLLAAFGPVLFGALYDVTNAWTIPLAGLLVLSCFIIFFGNEAGKNRLLDDEHRPLAEQVGVN